VQAQELAVTEHRSTVPQDTFFQYTDSFMAAWMKYYFLPMQTKNQHAGQRTQASDMVLDRQVDNMVVDNMVFDNMGSKSSGCHHAT
jgi:hypothetical protein